MKAVLLSIRPRRCANIASGKKRIEVRKDRPTIDVPFKGFIYCTNVKSLSLKEYVALHASTGGFCDKWSGKVIGEFVCDKIYEIHTYQESDNIIAAYSNEMRDDGLDIENATCLKEEEIVEYLSNAPKCSGYGWHISDLKIYDQPKELREFTISLDNVYCNYFKTKGCDRGCVSFGSTDYYCKDYWNWEKGITRPPQSWCYVEEL